MTLIPKNSQAEYGTDLSAEFSPDQMADYLTAYVANPLFRSARFEELVIDDDPYRRPVRPEDLGFLRFDRPFERADASRLSSLIGHRILLNVYDTAKPMFPREMTAERWEEFKLFYGERNRVLGELVRPFLERHVFDYVHRAVDAREAEAGPRDVKTLRQDLEALAADRRWQAENVVETVARTTGTAESAKMAAVQLLASTLNAPLQVDSRMLPWSPGAAVEPRAADRVDEILDALVATCGFGSQPHQYYQFYLPSTRALMNYLNATARDHGRVFRYLGAMCARTLDSVALIGGHGSRLAELAGSAAEDGVPDRAEALLARTSASPDAATAAAIQQIEDMVVMPLEQRFGPAALAEFSRGLQEYALLLDVHHDDLTTQLTWIDSSDACKAKAERLQHAIDEHRIPVALDTFVESWEECSTTHVHDEDRLLVIESGEMEFWNCFSGTHKFRPGDKLYIPKHRLHGSVVMSGECVYHQPVISAELDERYG